MKYELVVFDWDGTLIDSAGTIVQCIQDTARDLGVEVPERERASHVIGLGLHDSLRHAVPSLAPERYREFSLAYRRHFLARQDAMLLFPGIPQLLEELHRTRRLAIASDFVQLRCRQIVRSERKCRGDCIFVALQAALLRSGMQMESAFKQMTMAGGGLAAKPLQSRAL